MYICLLNNKTTTNTVTIQCIKSEQGLRYNYDGSCMNKKGLCKLSSTPVYKAVMLNQCCFVTGVKPFQRILGLKQWNVSENNFKNQYKTSHVHITKTDCDRQ